MRTVGITLLLVLLTTGVHAKEHWPTSEQDCMAANIYFESRSEELIGQYMVAYVTMNRVYSNNYPGTVCQVVKQYKQFSWYNPLRVKYPTDRSAWKRACDIATLFILDHPQSQIDLSEGATHYHASYVSPEWVKIKQYIGRVGKHLFYR